MLCRKLKHCLLINYRKNVPESPVAAQCNHTIDWSKATVVDREPDRLIRLIKEAIYTRKEGAQSMNRVYRRVRSSLVGLWLVFTP